MYLVMAMAVQQRPVRVPVVAVVPVRVMHFGDVQGALSPVRLLPGLTTGYVNMHQAPN
jgi:hypothetical protein